MTEENVAVPEMPLVPDAKVFDLKAALAGRTFPEKDVPVFLDESLAFALKQANEAALRNPASEELEAARQKLTEQFKNLTMTFHLRGVPRHVRVAVEARVEEEHPIKHNFMGAELSDPARDEKITEALWNAYVVSVTGPDGSRAVLTPDDVHEFRRMAPEASVDAVTAGIKSLIVDSETGYELGVQELSFLSQPSQGA